MAAQPVVQTRSPIRYEFYQNNQRMNISVLAKNLRPEDVIIDMSTSSLKVIVKHTSPAEEEEVVIDTKLFAAIDPAQSKVDIRKAKVEISLWKAVADVWPSLEGSGDACYLKAILPNSPILPMDGSTAVNPVSSSSAAAAAAVGGKKVKAYSSHRDWDMVSSEIDKELEAEKPEGEQALQKVFLF